MKEQNKDNLVYIDDILEAINKIKNYARGVEKEDFPLNGMLVDAVIRNLEIIGEAASKLTASFRAEHRDVEWRKIIGMRNRIIHSYDTVDHEIVWNVVEHDLPRLKKSIEKLIK